MTQSDKVRPKPTTEALAAMVHIVSSSRRTTGLQLPHAFLRESGKAAVPPLARLIRGGRGGEVRTKLYLTACVVASGSPYTYKRATPARAWAELLNLDDPAGKGARRVSDAFAWLDRNKYLKADLHRGRPPSFELLSQDLQGDPFTKPSRDYVSVPLGLWSSHWISAVSGAELGVMLAILDGPGDDEKNGAPRFLTEEQKERYGFSADSWTRATRQLQHIGVLEVTRKVAGGTMRYNRFRNVYRFPDPGLEITPSWPVKYPP